MWLGSLGRVVDSVFENGGSLSSCLSSFVRSLDSLSLGLDILHGVWLRLVDKVGLRRLNSRVLL